MRKFAVLGALAVLVVAGFGLAAKASTYNDKTTMTFNQPFEIPGGKVLPAGTYAFTVLDHTAYRHVIQIFNEDKTELYATVLAIPNYRLAVTDKTIITFAERPAGKPQAVKAWFYPGEKFGHQFVYPKQQAVELAKVVNEPVPSMPSELSTEITAPIKSAREAPLLSLENAPLTAEEPSGEEVPVAEAFPQAAPQNLPATASLLPLIGLIGTLSLATGIGLRIFARQSA